MDPTGDWRPDPLIRSPFQNPGFATAQVSRVNGGDCLPVVVVTQVSTVNSSWGKTSKERQVSVGDVVSELSIIREQLKHNNIVRYYKTFLLGEPKTTFSPKKAQMSVIFDRDNCTLSVHLHLQVTSLMLLRTTCSFYGNDSRRVGTVG